MTDMNFAGAALAVGITLAATCFIGALFAFAWGMATLEVFGARRARPAFIVLGLLLAGVVVGAALIGAAA